MIWILLLVALGALVWLGRRTVKRPNEWRSAAGIIGIACIVAGIAVMLRGLPVAGGIIVAVGLSLSLAAKRVILSSGPMSEARARRVLGVSDDADADAIQAAYRARMRTAHPDKGGQADLAAQLNAARDVLLKKRP